ncbi:MAG: ABC transporter permease [Caldilineaceae bacterium]
MDEETQFAESTGSQPISVEPPRRSLLSHFLRWEWLLVLLILLVIIVFSQLSPYFLNVNNLFRTSSDFIEMGLMMLPMTFIIISANIDLSVASALGMTASFMGFLFNHGINIWIAAGGALLLGTAGGLLNGYLVAYVRLPALVVTLGTFAFYRGIAYVLLGDQAARGYPQAFTYIGQGKVFGTQMPFSMLLFIVLALGFGLVLHKTAFGRYVYSIGNNEDACVYSGVPVARVKITIFAVSGFMAALAGIVMASRFGSTRPDIATGMELSVITATVLGGVDIMGGSGTMIGAVLSLLLIGLMRFGMGLMNIQGQVQSIAIGLLLIGSILLPTVARKLSTGGVSFDRSTALAYAVAIVVAVLFGWFFFWSRAPILAS